MTSAWAESWERVRVLVQKEFRQLLRDPQLRRILFLTPIIQLFLFGYAVSTDVRHTATFVVDHDRTPASRALLESLTAGGYFDVILRAMLSAHGLEGDDYQLLSVRDVRAHPRVEDRPDLRLAHELAR